MRPKLTRRIRTIASDAARAFRKGFDQAFDLHQPRAIECMELEDRTLLSAAPASVPPAPVPPALDASLLDAQGAGAAILQTEGAGEESAQTRELVFIDSAARGYEQLIEDLRSGRGGRSLDFVLLDANRDGIEQITEALAGHGPLDAIHLVSHGDNGAVRLGNIWITSSNLSAYASQLITWNDALGADADLLFYGCDVAAGDEGQALLATLSMLTGADVAASTDTTGHTFFGGDWDLEFTTGSIQTGLVFSHQLQENWSQVLAVGVDNTSLGQGIGSSVTVSHTTSGANRLMLVGISMGNPAGNSVTSVTYNGVALTLVGTHQIGTAPDEARTEIWALVAPSTGTHNVVVTLASAAPSGTTVGVMTFTGVDQTTPLGTFVSDAGNADNGTVNVSSAADELVFGVITVEAGTSDYEFVPGAGQTEHWDLFEGETNGGGSTEAGASTVAISWTFDAVNQWAIGAVPIHAANTAPTLDASRSPVLNAISEDAGAPSGAVGTLISSLVDFASPAGQVDNVTDPDSGALLGIAVTAADTSNGSWWYSTNNGANWNALGAVTGSNARLLAADANTRIYFQPNANFNGTLASALTFRAWDRTSGANGGTADTSANGGTTAFSTATDTASLTVNALNDAPTANAPASYSATEQVSLTLHGTGLSIADLDAAGGSVQTTLSVVAGTLTVAAGATGVSVLGSGTNTVTLTGTVAQINNLLAGNLGATATYVNSSDTPSATDTLTLQVDDQGNTGSGGAQTGSANSTINITAVNDAPVHTVPGPQTTNENTTLVFSAAGGNQVSVSDADAGGSSLQVTLTATSGTLSLNGTAGLSFTAGDGTADATMTFTGSLANINAALNGMGFAPTTGYSGPATLQILTNDQGNTGTGGALSDSDTVNISVAAVNDAPVNTVPGAQSVNEDTPLIFSGGGGNQISISDVDAGSNPVRVTLTASSGTVSLSGITGLSFIAGDGTADATMTFTGTQTDINAALNGLTFMPTADFSGVATLQIITNDQGFSGSGGPLSDSDTVNITVSPVNDPPVISVPPAQSTNEDTPLVFSSIGGNRISVDDVDAGSSPLQITLTVNNGALTLAGTAGLTFISGDGTADATMTFTGTLVDINFALDGLSFVPATSYNGAATLQIIADDLGNSGSGGPLTDNDSVNITVGAVNDAPVNSVPAAQSTNEDTPLVLSAAHGNLISVSDLDAGASLVEVTLTAANGTLTLAGTAGLTFTTADGTADATMTFAGTLTDINAALDGLRFSPTANFSGLTTLQIISNDQGFSGSGGPLSDADTVNITVNAVNDAPVLSLPGIQSPTSMTVVFSGAAGNAITVSDVDAAGMPLRVALAAVNGTLTLSSTAGLVLLTGTGTGDAQMEIVGDAASINAALDGLRLDLGAGPGGSTFSITVDDQGAAGQGGPQLASGMVAVQQVPLIPPPAPSDSDTQETDSESESESDSEDSIVPGVEPIAPGQESSGGSTVDDSSRDRGGSRTVDNGGQLSQAATLSGPIEEDEDPFFLQEFYAGGGGWLERLAGASGANATLSRRDLGSLDVTLLWNQLDALADDILPEEMLSTFSVGAAAGVSAVFSAGYVAWCLRSGALLASAISSLPMWRSFDPLPVLEFWEKRARRRNQQDDEKESVEELVEGIA